MYSKIVNPNTGRKVSTKSKLGQKILRKYINSLYYINKGGSASPAPSSPTTPKKNSKAVLAAAARFAAAGFGAARARRVTKPKKSKAAWAAVFAAQSAKAAAGFGPGPPLPSTPTTGFPSLLAPVPTTPTTGFPSLLAPPTTPTTGLPSPFAAPTTPTTGLPSPGLIAAAAAMPATTPNQWAAYAAAFAAQQARRTRAPVGFGPAPAPITPKKSKRGVIGKALLRLHWTSPPIRTFHGVTWHSFGDIETNVQKHKFKDLPYDIYLKRGNAVFTGSKLPATSLPDGSHVAVPPNQITPLSDEDQIKETIRLLLGKGV